MIEFFILNYILSVCQMLRFVAMTDDFALKNVHTITGGYLSYISLKKDI